MRSTDAELRPRRMSRLSPVQMVLSVKLVICLLRRPVSHTAASYDLIRLTYSSCVPIHTQMKSSPSAIASALYERPTRTDQNVLTFLNCSEGCLGFALSRSKLCRATLCIDSGISLRSCQNSGVARCIGVPVRCRLPWVFWPVRLVVRNLCNDGLIGTGPFPGHTGLYGDYRRAIWHSTPVISRMLVY